jgi:putative membrane protein
MMFILRWLLVALLFVIIAQYVPGITVASFYTALILAVFWGIVNVVLKPILLVLTLPVNLLTLGLFTLVINGFLFWLLSTFIKGFYVESFWYAILGAILLSLGSSIVNHFLKKSNE